MLETMELLPGITLRCFRDDRFKQGALSIQFIRLMKKEEASLNALLPAVLLRGTEFCPDLRAITWRLDDLYGASVSALVRRVGDHQTTGLFCAFMEDRFALEGDKIMEPMVAFLEELLFHPLLEDDVFCDSFVRSEKKNLISTIESMVNDKRAYAASQLRKLMCRGDSFALDRLGEKEDVEKIDPQTLYEHYQRVLRESPVELFYVGSAEATDVAALLKKPFEKLERAYRPISGQTAFSGDTGVHESEQMDVAQAKLCMGFTTEITNRDPRFAAMQVFNTLYGAGMTSKLFMNLREKQSLCYSIGSSYFSTKGILTVSAGIDTCSEGIARAGIFEQLRACCDGEITEAELAGAKEAIISGLQGVHDSPGAIEGYYETAFLSGCALMPQDYISRVMAVTVQDVAAVASSVQYHSSFCLKGGVQ